MEPQWALLAILLAGYALIAARLDRLSVGPALAFVAIGIFLANDRIGSISFTPAAELIKILAEATLALLLFATPRPSRHAPSSGTSRRPRGC